MSWIEVSLATTCEAIDWVNTLLGTIDYANEISITNYDEPNCDQPNRNEPNEQSSALLNIIPLDLTTPHTACSHPWAFTIRLYLPNTVSARAQVEEIERLFSPLHRTGMATVPETVVLPEKPEFSAINAYRIGKRFVVLAAAETEQAVRQSLAATDIPLKLEASCAFGSGTHPTTIVSLKLLERYIAPEMQVLDLGSGSGILSIAMAKLGAKVLSIDNDRTAVTATQNAVNQNDLASQVTVIPASLGSGSNLGHWMGGELTDPVPAIEASARFNLIVSNIPARIQLALVPDFYQALRSSGYLISAGFTTDYEEEIVAGFAQQGFQVVDCERYNEWVGFCLLVQK